MVEKNRQEKESLCEKSMQLMVNIIKLSSFSLAGMNLGNKHETDDGPTALLPVKPFPRSPSMSKSKRSQAPLSKPYLVEQDPGDLYQSSLPSPLMVFGTKDDRRDDDGDFSDYIKRFHARTENEAMNADGRASDYIRKFHQKNSRAYNLAASTSLPLVLPPPPPSVKK